MKGFEPKPEVAVGSLDILVHASIKPEPFGRVIVEAMASGTPVVASKSGGCVEIIENGVDGFLVEPGDTDEMAQAVETLLRNKGISDEFSKRGKEKVFREFSLEKTSGELISFYDEILGSSAKKGVRIA